VKNVNVFFRTSKLSRFAIFVFVGSIIAGAYLVRSFPDAPPDGLAGHPPDYKTCTECHSSFPLNSGPGRLTLSGVPTVYAAGDTYAITVTLQQQAQKVWGFEVAVLDSSSHQAGRFILTDSVNTQLSDNADPKPDYLKNTLRGTASGTADGPVSWTFKWKAPDHATGPITFYAVGNAGNNDYTFFGDYVYATTAPSSPLPVRVGEVSTRSPAPIFYRLEQNYPNPFNPLTTIRFELLQSGRVKLHVFNLSGQQVVTLVDRSMPAGRHSVEFDARDLPSGVYVVTLEVNRFVSSRKMTILR